MKPLPLACPAATEVRSPSGAQSVRCGVLAVSNDGAHIDGWTERGRVDAVFDGEKDVNTVRYFCCDDGTAASKLKGYRNCVVWKAQRDADAAGRKGPGALRDEEAERMDARPDARVAGALDVLADGSFSEQGALERAMQAGGVVLGG